MSKKYTTIIRRDKSVIDINNDIHEVKDLKENIKLQSIENERLCNVVKEIQNGIDVISTNSCSLQDILKQREAVINELTLKLSNLSSTYEDRIIKLEEKNNNMHDNMELYKKQNQNVYKDLDNMLIKNNELQINYDSINKSFKEKNIDYSKLQSCLLQERQWFLVQIDNLQTALLNLNKINVEKDEYIFQQDKIIREYLNNFLFNTETYFTSDNGNIITVHSEKEMEEIMLYNKHDIVEFLKNNLLELYENTKKIKKELDHEIYKNIISDQKNVELKKMYSEYHDNNRKITKENIFLKKKVNVHSDKMLMEEYEKEIENLQKNMKKLQDENEQNVKKYTNIIADTNNTYYEEINTLYKKEESLVNEIKKFNNELESTNEECNNLKEMLEIKRLETIDLENIINSIKNKKCENCKEKDEKISILESRNQHTLEYSDETDTILKSTKNSLQEKNEKIKKLEKIIEHYENQNIKDDNIETLNKKIKIQNGIIESLKIDVTNLKNNEILMTQDINEFSTIKESLRNEINTLKSEKGAILDDKELLTKQTNMLNENNKALKDFIIDYNKTLKIMLSNIHDHEKLAGVLRSEEDKFEKSNFNFI